MVVTKVAVEQTLIFNKFTKQDTDKEVDMIGGISCTF